jgi:nucleoside-diphosphate-sugar epimerase
MSYLITGGTGFIGIHIARLLAQEGEEVVTYDIDPRRDILEYLMSKKEIALVKVIKGDITDVAHLIRTAKEHHSTRIIHMAALLSIDSSANPALAVQINCGGTANILETARILRVEKVIYASSNTVFGPAEKYEGEYIPNDAPHYPSTIYGACKSFIERLAGHYFNEYGVDGVGLRFPVVYGMGHKGGVSALITEELMVKPALGKPGRVPCRDDTLNWLYVEDAARGVVMASRRATTKTRCFNIDGEICPVVLAANYVRKIVPDADITLLPGSTGFTGKYETSRIREEIGYRSQWPLEKGIEQVISAVRKMNNWQQKS